MPQANKMKKISLILLISVYALSTLGIGINQFYCCGKLKSVNISFVQPAKEKCSGENAMSGCCKTEFKAFKIKDSHVSADAIIAPVKHFTDLHNFTPSFNLLSIANRPITNTNASHAPPLGHGVAVYILHCAYLI